MRIACLGGGPGGVFFAALIRRLAPQHSVDVFERNSPDSTFGFGVVFSDATLWNLAEADPVLAGRLSTLGQKWDDIEVRVKGEVLRCGGNGMVAIPRTTLLSLLYERAAELGANLRFHSAVENLEELDQFDLVVGSDGVNSLVRSAVADPSTLTVESAKARFIWFGTTYGFKGLTFLFEESPGGVFAVHGYPISDEAGTFIVETDVRTWRAEGMDRFDTTQPPGASDMFAKEYLEALFERQIGGARLLVNNSRWASFRTVRNTLWHRDKYVLLGDSAHTAHFSVGSGTKMAMEDAAALAACLAEETSDTEGALARYEELRRPGVETIQGSAVPSLSWWENFSLYHEAFEPQQFAFHFFTRAISGERLNRRDSGFVREAITWWQKRFGSVPLDSSFQLGDVRLTSRAAEISISSDGRNWARLMTSNGPTNLELHRHPFECVSRGPAVLLEIDSSKGGMRLANAQLETAYDSRPCLVAVAGGSSFERRQVAERARLEFGVPSMVVEQQFDFDESITTLLSGRADLVGTWRGIASIDC